MTTLGPVAAIHRELGTDTQAVLLHGWLDNAESFSLLAPQLSISSWALDLPGHGLSPWLADGADYYIWSYLPMLTEALQQLPKQTSVVLVGHSLGTAAALQLAALHPERIAALVLLDGVGPQSSLESKWLAQMQQALKWQPKPKRIFESIEDALAVRAKATPSIESQVLRIMVERALESHQGGWRWRADPRLQAPSKMRLTEAMVQALLEAVRCPVLAVRAEQGILPRALYRERIACIPDVQCVDLPGHHHFHLQRDASSMIASRVQDFLEQVGVV